MCFKWVQLKWLYSTKKIILIWLSNTLVIYAYTHTTNNIIIPCCFRFKLINLCILLPNMVISRTFTSLGAYTSFREHKRLKMYIKKKKAISHKLFQFDSILLLYILAWLIILWKTWDFKCLLTCFRLCTCHYVDNEN